MIDITDQVDKFRMRHSPTTRPSKIQRMGMLPEVSILAIDPSLHKMGYCYIHRGRLRFSGVIQTIKKKYPPDQWLNRLDDAAEQLFVLAGTCRPISKVVIEMPTIWGGSPTSNAATNSSSLMKLQALVFTLREWFLLRHAPVTLLTPQQWKGQIPKHVMLSRVAREVGFQPKDHNEAHAIGLALFYLRTRTRAPAPTHA